MNPPANQPESSPPRPPGIYRVLSGIVGPVEKLLGITCRDYTQLASEKLDRPLTAGERRRYFMHRLLCDICRRQEKRMRQINWLAHESLQRAGNDDTVNLDAAARERIRESVARELNRD